MHRCFGYWTSAGYSHANRPNFDKLSHRFAVTVKNLGLPLHEPRLSLVLTNKDGSGTLRIDLARCSVETGEIVANRAELAKGMVALFEVRPDTFRLGFAESIRRHMESDRYMDIYDSGFLVQTFRIGGWRDRIGTRWNRFAHSINWRFNRKVTTNDGRELLKVGAILPTLRNWQSGVDYFLDSFQEERRGVEERDTRHGTNSADPATDRTN